MRLQCGKKKLGLTNIVCVLYYIVMSGMSSCHLFDNDILFELIGYVFFPVK